MPTWTRACATHDIELDDLIRFDHGSQTFIIVRSEDDTFHAMDGICSHEKVHLCDGLVMEGTVECPKHNATFDYRTGEAKRAPACVNLKTFPVRVEDGQVWIEIRDDIPPCRLCGNALARPPYRLARVAPEGDGLRRGPVELARA